MFASLAVGMQPSLYRYIRSRSGSFLYDTLAAVDLPIPDMVEAIGYFSYSMCSRVMKPSGLYWRLSTTYRPSLRRCRQYGRYADLKSPNDIACSFIKVEEGAYNKSDLLTNSALQAYPSRTTAKSVVRGRSLSDCGDEPQNLYDAAFLLSGIALYGRAGQGAARLAGAVPVFEPVQFRPPRFEAWQAVQSTNWRLQS